METTTDLVGATQVSACALTALNALIRNWQSSPEQLHHLRDDVERFEGLLTSIGQSEDALRLVADHQDAALIREMGLASRALESIQTIVKELQPGERDGQVLAADASRSSEAKWRHRWALRREDIARIQRSIQLSCHHILSRLVVRALYVFSYALARGNSKVLLFCS